MSSRILCCVSERFFNIPNPTKLGRTELQGSNPRRSYRDYDGVNGESTEFEWNIFPGFTTLQLCGKINDLLSDLGQTPETFTGRISLMSMFNDISYDRKNKQQTYTVEETRSRGQLLERCCTVVCLLKNRITPRRGRKTETSQEPEDGA